MNSSQPLLRLHHATFACLLTAILSPNDFAQTAPAPASTRPPDEVVQLAPFEIAADKGTRGYGTTNALGGTRINTALADTPQAVVSLNQEFLKDINPTNFADALRFVSGVTKVEGEYSGVVSLRGIQTSATGFRDSIGDNLGGVHGTSAPDPIEVERLEVVKGPAGVLYGSHGFGGVINRVSKRPLEQPRTEVGLEYTRYEDSEGYYRFALDATGPAGTNQQLLYRLLYARLDGTNHLHGGYHKNTVIGMADWRAAPRTSLSVRARYTDDQIFSQQDLWTDSARNMPFNDLPRFAFVGNYANDDAVDSDEVAAYETGLTHAFDVLGQTWSARLFARYNDSKDQRRTYISSGSFFYRNGAALKVGTADMSTANATWTQARTAGYDDIRENIQRRDIRNGTRKGYGLNFDLTGTLQLGPTRHQLLTYTGKSEADTFQRRFRENWIAPKPSVFTKTSVEPTKVLDNNPQTLANEWTTTMTELHNFAVQDNVSLFENRLNLVGAARYDSGTTGVVDHRANTRLADETTAHWTPTYGVVGKPIRGVSIFYTHGETFQPQGGANQSGERLRPLIGDNDEAGVKLDLWQSRLVVTGSYFNMLQENAFIKVILPDGTFDFRQVPSSVSKGWELDVAAQPFRGLTLLASYQWINAKTQNGLAVRNVPQGGTYKAVVKYALPATLLQGVELGANYEHINDGRVGDTGNTFRLPGYNLTGLFAIYKRAHWRVQINIENLTDAWYIAGATAQQFMRSGAPRNYRFSSTYTF
jgi:iron complex outermembrane recepter protein